MSVLTGHVANAAARVAGLVLLETATVAARLVATTAVAVTALGAVAGNVADLAALGIVSADEQTRLGNGAEREAHLVALSAGAASTASGGRLRAVARDVTGSAAAVAGLGVLGALRAVTAHVALACPQEKHRSATVRHVPRKCSRELTTTVVALGGATVGAVTSLYTSHFGSVFRQTNYHP